METKTVETTNETTNQMNLFQIIEAVETENYNIIERPKDWKEMLFDVCEIPTYISGYEKALAINCEVDEKINPIEENVGYKAIINKDNGNILSTVKKTYNAVSNIAVLEHFETLLKDQKIKFEYGFAKSARGGRKTVFEIILPEHTIDLKNGDKQELRLYIQNSFDGGNAIKLDIGFFRHMCSNMAMMEGNADLQYKTSHIGNAEERIKSQFNFYITEQFDKSKQFVESLAFHKFNSTEEVMEFINSDDNEKIVSKRYREKVLDRWNWTYKFEHGLTFWGLYNAYTHIITHDMTGKEIGKMDKLVMLSKAFNKLIDKKLQAVSV